MNKTYEVSLIREVTYTLDYEDNWVTCKDEAIKMAQSIAADYHFNYEDDWTPIRCKEIDNDGATQESTITIKELVHSKINKIFLDYQAIHDIPSGDISPLDQLRLYQIEESLVSLIKSMYENTSK